MLLYFGSWLLLGNLLALAGSSVGAVYYDRLIGGNRFSDLVSVLETSGVANTMLGQIQELLWIRYDEVSSHLGLGISAFPSMHVAIAAITALYLHERSRWLAPVGVGFLAIILFASIYTGYHYAIDGYFSIAAVVFANRLLLKYQNRAARDQALQGIAA